MSQTKSLPSAFLPIAVTLAVLNFAKAALCGSSAQQSSAVFIASDFSHTRRTKQGTHRPEGNIAIGSKRRLTGKALHIFHHVVLTVSRLVRISGQLRRHSECSLALCHRRDFSRITRTCEFVYIYGDVGMPCVRGSVLAQRHGGNSKQLERRGIVVASMVHKSRPADSLGTTVFVFVYNV